MPKNYVENNVGMVWFSAEERLDGYYNIAAASGLSCSESVISEWWDWAHREYGHHGKIEVEGISVESMVEFENYLTEEDE